MSTVAALFVDWVVEPFSTGRKRRASHLLDRNRPALCPRAVGGERGDEGGPRLAERADALASLADGLDERRELRSVGGPEALHEVPVAGAVRLAGSRLHRAGRARVVHPARESGRG